MINSLKNLSVNNMESEEERQRKNQQTLHKMMSKISPELLSEFLYKRGVKDVRCVFCDSEDVVVPQTTINPNQPDEVTFIDYVKVDGSGPPFSLMHYQYRLICRNCGYTHNLAVYPVMKWAGVIEGAGDE